MLEYKYIKLIRLCFSNDSLFSTFANIWGFKEGGFEASNVIYPFIWSFSCLIFSKIKFPFGTVVFETVFSKKIFESLFRALAEACSVKGILFLSSIPKISLRSFYLIDEKFSCFSKKII